MSMELSEGRRTEKVGFSGLLPRCLFDDSDR